MNDDPPTSDDVEQPTEPPEEFYEPDGEGMASVISVDRNDDVASVCGRVDTAPTYWVILHAPRGNRTLSTELGMRRLRRHAEDSGRAVAFATRSPSLASRARQVGIPAARTPEAVRWDAGGRTIFSLGRGRALVIPAIGRYLQAIVLIAVVASFLFLLVAMAPSARVIAYPETTTLSTTVTLTASPETDAVDFENLVVPATTVSASRVFTIVQPTTGSVDLPQTAATVDLAVTNPGDSPATVPAGAVALGGPELLAFALLEAVTVAPGETVTVPAQAAEPGPLYNLEAGQIGGWLSEDLRSLTVTNPAPASGGDARTARAVAGADVVAIRDQEQVIRTALATRIVLVEELPHDAIFLDTVDIEAEEVEPPASIGTQTDLVIVRYRVILTGQAIERSTLEEVATAVLVEDAGPGVFMPGSFQALQVGEGTIDAESGDLQATFEISGEFAPDLTAEQVRSAVKGRSADSAKSTLQERYGMEDTDVQLTPGFAPWLPRFDFRIDIDFRSREELLATPDDTDSEGSAGTATPTPPADDEATPTPEGE
ncbi:MAG: baseplate J/gp47 family protein [Dehalococcoidia bacterium]